MAKSRFDSNSQTIREAEAIDRVIKASATYKLLADDVVVWTGNRFPTRDEIDRAAGDANERGWNGTQLDLCCNDQWLDFVDPSEEVLA